MFIIRKQLVTKENLFLFTGFTYSITYIISRVKTKLIHQAVYRSQVVINNSRDTGIIGVSKLVIFPSDFFIYDDGLAVHTRRI